MGEAVLEEREPDAAAGRGQGAGTPPAGTARLAARPALVVAALLSLVAASAAYRLEGQSTWLWIDEAISVGIGSHPITEITDLLRQDGSPPLYYLVLHVWMAVVGQSEADLHALSFLFTVAIVPVGYWAGRSLFGERAGWFCALLAAANPYLTAYSREARMYTMVALLALVVVTTFLHAFVLHRRRYVPAFVASLVLLLYTHNWALFLALGLVVAAGLCVVVATDRRRTLVHALLAFGTAALAYSPWLPTAAYQAAHTGAPWAPVPGFAAIGSAMSAVLGGAKAVVILAVMVVIVAATAAGRNKGRWWAPFGALLVVIVVALGGAWAGSQVRPSWSHRYFGILVTPLLLVIAAGLSRVGRRGLVALALVLLLWTGSLAWVAGRRIPPRADDKSNVKWLAAQLAPLAQPGDVVASAEIEEVPLLRYYLPAGLRYATPEGVVADPRVVDWRDALQRLSQARAGAALGALLDQLPVGGHVFLVCPRYVSGGSDEGAPVRVTPAVDDASPTRGGSGITRGSTSVAWDGLVDHHCRSWRDQLANDGRIALALGQTPPSTAPRRGASVFALAYEKTAS